MFDNRKKAFRNKKVTEQSELRSVINMVIARDFGPCICFAFSKSECENYARVVSKCEYTEDEE